MERHVFDLIFGNNVSAVYHSYLAIGRECGWVEIPGLRLAVFLEAQGVRHQKHGAKKGCQVGGGWDKNLVKCCDLDHDWVRIHVRTRTDCGFTPPGRGTPYQSMLDWC